MQWVTGAVLCWEDHTITHILTAPGLESRWRVLESFAEYGAWSREGVERRTMRLGEQERPARWGRYHPVALDDTTWHRTSAAVWGTCTFHGPSARSPNRAETARAHNWVVLGDLGPGTPWTFLPQAARLYLRESQLPPGEPFQTKPALGVELFREADAEAAAPLLAVFDGAYAVESVVRPRLSPEPGGRRSELLTRLRPDARLYQPLQPQPHAKGRRRKGGLRLPTPRRHAQWAGAWQAGTAGVYGRVRPFKDKQLGCPWAVSGPGVPVHAVVCKIEGDKEPWFLVTSARDLAAAQVVEADAARFRQEDAFREHKQRLGMEECRAWTKEPGLRAFQVQVVALAGSRLPQWRCEQQGGTGWQPPPWNPRKAHASILDPRRLLWRHRPTFSHFLAALEELEKSPHALPPHDQPLAMAA